MQIVGLRLVVTGQLLSCDFCWLSSGVSLFSFSVLFGTWGYFIFAIVPRVRCFLVSCCFCFCSFVSSVFVLALAPADVPLFESGCSILLEILVALNVLDVRFCWWQFLSSSISLAAAVGPWAPSLLLIGIRR